MKLYFIRHGEDTPGYRGGWSLFSLTEKGKNQALNLANSIKDIAVDYIIASDLPRAKETAEIVAHVINKDIKIDPMWREYNNGVLAGMRIEDAEKNYPHLIFAEIDMDDRFPNGETPREYYERILAAYKKLVALNKNILVVTHGGVMDVIYHLANGYEWTNSSPHKKIFENCELLEIDL